MQLTINNSRYCLKRTKEKIIKSLCVRQLRTVICTIIIRENYDYEAELATVSSCRLFLISVLSF